MKNTLNGILYCSFLLFLCGCSVGSWKVIVHNYSDIDRSGEIIEVPVSDLQSVFDLDGGFVVYDSKGNEIPSQVTYDDLLIFAVDVPKSSKTKYTVKKGIPSEYQTYATGRVYPERVDDLAWESDLIAFRIYGPALQRSGERAFGNDVWVKNNTSLPVVKERYDKELNPETRKQIEELSRTDPAAATELSRSVVYHYDHGNGCDAYSVGPTLGAGRTAVMLDNTIIYPYCYSKCEILDNGPLRFTASLEYNNSPVDTMWVREHRRISIDKGSYLNHEIVWYENLKEEHELVSGIVVHELDGGVSYFDKGNRFASHIDPMSGEFTKKSDTYIGMLFPNHASDIRTKPIDASEMASGAYSHVIAVNSVDGPEPLDYYWGAAWSLSTEKPVRTFNEWNSYLDSFYKKIKNPLDVEVR